jgi:SAM-dependent methyltransferase
MPMPPSSAAARSRAAAPASLGMTAAACRFCAAPLQHVFIDLGATPPANAYLEPEQLNRGEVSFPLRAYVCERCFLVQLEAFQSPDEIFGHYAYFSSFSQSWLDHAKAFAEAATEQLALGPKSLVVEVASNDGYLLQYFRELGVPVLGIEPAANVAAVARSRGIPTVTRFFGRAAADKLLAEGKGADLLVGNNVLAHVPDLNDFVAGLARLLKPTGTLSLEFPHLLKLIEQVQFDTIYHEHFSYFSLGAAERVLAAHGLEVVDVEELATHGGSLRLSARHCGRTTPSARVAALRNREARAGLADLAGYRGFAERVATVKHDLLRFLIEARIAGKRVVGYGAAAKGNTLLNSCGIRGDLLDYVVDVSPHKQGRYLPGSRLPIVPPARLRETEPDYVLILPWNLADEIRRDAGHIAEWGGRFVIAIPRLVILS